MEQKDSKNGIRTEVSLYKGLIQFLNIVWKLFAKHFFHSRHIQNCMTSIFPLWMSTRDLELHYV